MTEFAYCDASGSIDFGKRAPTVTLPIGQLAAAEEILGRFNAG